MAEPERPSRRSIRLKQFDYSTSAGYVVTLCSYQRRLLFGGVGDGVVELSPLGHILHEEWFRTAEIRSTILLDQFIIMPNHVHGIVILTSHTGGSRGSIGHGGPSRTLSAIVRGFKSACTARVKRESLPVPLPIWQRGFYDRVIRDDSEFEKFARYIANNPQQWELDRHYRP